jgi:hypothetical protein
MTAEYVAVAVGAFVLMVILIWKQLRLDRQLRQLRKEVDQLQIMESRRFLMDLNAHPTVDAPKTEPDSAPAESDRGACRPAVVAT